MYKKDSSLKAFTLAEVLVTLAVIGIVASLTIPNLTKSYQNTETASKVKKYQSLLQQAVNNYASDNDCIGNLAACKAFAEDVDHQQLWDELKPYFRYIKDCGHPINDWSECFASSYKFLNGTDVADSASNGYKAMLSDGASIILGDYAGNCEEDRSRSEPPNETALEYVCGVFLLDINGLKGPNQVGRDFFLWQITRSGIVYPAGSLDDTRYTETDGTPDCEPSAEGGMADPGGGAGCTARVIREGCVNY